MQYAIVDGNKVEATKSGERGKCQGCGNEVVAKCGEIKINHWAHLSSQKCDFEREAETEWHREWKSYFENVEVRQEKDGEVCIADALNNKGVAIEFQHSPINAETIKKRERVHGKVIWVVDCRSRDIMHYNIPKEVDDSYLQAKRKYNQKIDNLVLDRFATVQRRLNNELDLIQSSYKVEVKKIVELLFKNEGLSINTDLDRFMSFDWTNFMYSIEHHLKNKIEQELINEKPKKSKTPIYRYRWNRASGCWEYSNANIFLQIDDHKLIYVKDNTMIGGGYCVPITKQDFINRYAV